MLMLTNQIAFSKFTSLNTSALMQCVLNFESQDPFTISAFSLVVFWTPFANHCRERSGRVNQRLMDFDPFDKSVKHFIECGMPNVVSFWTCSAYDFQHTSLFVHAILTHFFTLFVFFLCILSLLIFHTSGVCYLLFFSFRHFFVIFRNINSLNSIFEMQKLRERQMCMQIKKFLARTSAFMILHML